MTTTTLISCAWCDKPLRVGVGHGICAGCAASLVGEWVLPPQEEGIDARWIDAFICTRLQDVLARRYFDTPFPKLSVEDRAAISQRVEKFIADTERYLAWSGRIQEQG